MGKINAKNISVQVFNNIKNIYIRKIIINNINIKKTTVLS